ncbi:MAG TPA: hypothetical protein VMT91_11495 [Anaerolineales bacterium]|nr:hypothetical protein [Anaerolineales bacterium]
MNFLKNFLAPGRSNPGTFYKFSVKCSRCGEIIHGKVNVFNDPSLEMDENGKSYYLCRKVLMGDQKCFQRIEVIFKFTEARGLLDRQISGGEFVQG